MTGRTLNPYDNRKTAGGSSGGEGAIIGSGASLFGVGSDIAGSIRVPAHFNGIFGHKPTPGENKRRYKNLEFYRRKKTGPGASSRESSNATKVLKFRF